MNARHFQAHAECLGGASALLELRAELKKARRLPPDLEDRILAAVRVELDRAREWSEDLDGDEPDTSHDMQLLVEGSDMIRIPAGLRRVVNAALGREVQSLTGRDMTILLAMARAGDLDQLDHGGALAGWLDELPAATKFAAREW